MLMAEVQESELEEAFREVCEKLETAAADIAARDQQLVDAAARVMRFHASKLPKQTHVTFPGSGPIEQACYT